MEVIALVGASGTGKSHRAQLVAYEQEADAIIDDGLLIKDSKILAGKSAKREATRVAAVKRALFVDPEHAREVKERVLELNPRRVLILGTSLGMVEKIAERLSLPAPTRVISIEQVATAEEIRRAMKIRREQGKHVIPAPTLEVKKTFSGYLVDPLRFFLRPKAESAARSLVIEKSVVRPTFSSLGKFYIADTVVASVAARVVLGIPGVARVLKVLVESRIDGVEINVDVAVKYGYEIPAVLEQGQRQVKEMVEYMTALNVLAINLAARRLVFEENPATKG